MFYLDLPVEDWLAKYPALISDEPLCDCAQATIVPFKTKKSVGIICRRCNSGAWIRSSYLDNQKLLELFIDNPDL